MTASVRDETIGIVGVGSMGSAIATSLLRGGFRVVVYDVDPEAAAEVARRGASVAGSVAELARTARIISVVVVDSVQVTAVVRAAVEVAMPGAVLIVHSTVRPATVVELATEVAHRGVTLVDAPVTGGSEKAARGTLTVMVGGDEETVGFCRPLFESIGAHVFHLGPVGAGQVMKLANNVMSLGGYALQMDAMQLARAYGLDEDSVTRVVTVGQGDSRGIRTWGRFDRIRRARGGSIANITKDMFEALAAGELRGLELPIIAAVAKALPSQVAERDRQLPSFAPETPIPRCRVCDQELAAPFREAGVHPECRDSQLSRA